MININGYGKKEAKTMDDASKWWDSKKKELQKCIDEALEGSDGEKKKVFEVMKEMVANVKVKAV